MSVRESYVRKRLREKDQMDSNSKWEIEMEWREKRRKENQHSKNRRRME